MEDMKNENIEICKKCGGMCCKKSGCDYSAHDFLDLSYEGLSNELKKGDKSIVCYMDFKTMSNGSYTYEPFLYLRARNKGRDIIDLVSIKTGCASLKSNGCSFTYEDRPSGGKNLTPVDKKIGPCTPVVNPLDIVNTWKPYQKQLKRLVSQFTGMSFDKKIRADVEELFYEVLTEKFHGVSQLELEDIKGFTILLTRVFPQELNRASNRYRNIKVLVRK